MNPEKLHGQSAEKFRKMVTRSGDDLLRLRRAPTRYMRPGIIEDERGNDTSAYIATFCASC